MEINWTKVLEAALVAVAGEFIVQLSGSDKPKELPQGDASY